MNNYISSQGLNQLAYNYSECGIVRLREIFTPGTLKVPKTHTALKLLDSIHKVCVFSFAKVWEENVALYPE
ncbi:hypothetical protein ACH5RR_037065 [Cinchona calisaya]|uniref:Uncharacterized protein n=1 Tax=Cinchona calisaya TaxID=153742 RepID=A0ABD2Y7C3_9GENT